MRFRFTHCTLRASLGCLCAVLITASLSASERRSELKAASAISLTFAQLASCPLFGPDEDVALPPMVQAAKDHEVRVVGYMLPLTIEHGRAREFLLMRNQNGCCFGQMPAANEFLVVQTDSGRGLPITMDVPMTVQGTLRIEPIIFDRAYAQFYRLENARATTAQ